MNKSLSELCGIEGLNLKDLEENARAIVIAYAGSDNADTEKIPTLYKSMIQAQLDVLCRSAPETEE